MRVPAPDGRFSAYAGALRSWAINGCRMKFPRSVWGMSRVIPVEKPRTKPPEVRR